MKKIGAILTDSPETVLKFTKMYFYAKKKGYSIPL